ncbi:MAG: hypothetical protein GY754_40545 [bacterium]|nr:hypothetical protein [bacterium]
MIRKQLLLIFLSLSLFYSCASTFGSYSKLDIGLPENGGITEQDIRSLLPPVSPAPSPGKENITIDISIYYYSSGIELLKYTEDDVMTVSYKDGGIKAILKIKANNKVQDVLFITAEGKDKTDILNNFAAAIKEHMR